jgi:hypothetical protein
MSAKTGLPGANKFTRRIKSYGFSVMPGILENGE